LRLCVYDGLDLDGDEHANHYAYMKKWLDTNHSFKNFTYDKKELKTSFNFSYISAYRIGKKDKNLAVESIASLDQLTIDSHVSDARIWHQLPIYEMDMASRNKNRDLAILKNNPNGFILLRKNKYKPSRYSRHTEKELQNKIKEHELLCLKDIKTIGETINIVTSYKSVKPLRIAVVKRGKSTGPVVTHIPCKYISFDNTRYRCELDDKWKSHALTYKKDTDELTTNYNYGFYKDRKTYFILVDKVSNFTIDTELHLKMKILNLYDGLNFIVINNKFEDKIKDKKLNNVNLIDVKEFIKTPKNIKKINDYLENSSLWGLYEDDIRSNGYEKINFGTSDIGKAIKTVKDKISAIKKTNSRLYSNLNKYISMYFESNFKYVYDSEIEKVKNTIKQIKKKYKLFELFQTYRMESFTKEINEYIELINNKK